MFDIVYKECYNVLDQVTFSVISCSDFTFRLIGEIDYKCYEIIGREIWDNGVKLEITVGDAIAEYNIFDDYELDDCIKDIENGAIWM